MEKRYCLKGDYPRIGNSDYYCGIYYKITNPKALYREKPEDEYVNNPFANMNNFLIAAGSAIKKPDKETVLIGEFVHKPFNSVKLFIDGTKWEDEDEPIWECRIFLDTQKVGSTAIASSHSLEEVYQRVINILGASDAVLDLEKLQEDIEAKETAIKNIAKQSDFLKALKETEEERRSIIETSNSR